MEPDEIRVPVNGGVTLHAWLFRPLGAGPFPAITMAHGFGGLKYHGLRQLAERFRDAGFVVLVHDHRSFGLSEGEPRNDIDPWRQIEDWRRIITYLESVDDVDRTRLGVWGTSFAGGHAMVLGATDRRLKAVVAQVPICNGYEQGLRRVPAELRAAVQERFNADERGQLSGRAPQTQLLNSLEPGTPAAYHSQDMFDFFASFPIPDGVPAADVVTVRSSLKASQYEPGTWAGRVSPTPLMMLVGTGDLVTPTDIALRTYEQALQPKRLVMFDGGHFDAYDAQFETTSAAATEWFVAHLRS